MSLDEAHAVAELYGHLGTSGHGEGWARIRCRCGAVLEGRGAGGAYLAHCQHQIQAAKVHGTPDHVGELEAEFLEGAM